MNLFGGDPYQRYFAALGLVASFHLIANVFVGWLRRIDGN